MIQTKFVTNQSNSIQPHVTLVYLPPLLSDNSHVTHLMLGNSYAITLQSGDPDVTTLLSGDRCDISTVR
jgi:hypothetical protein